MVFVLLDTFATEQYHSEMTRRSVYAGALVAFLVGTYLRPGSEAVFQRLTEMP